MQAIKLMRDTFRAWLKSDFDFAWERIIVIT